MEQGNAKGVGRQVSKSGNRFEAQHPVALGLTDIFGGMGPDRARRWALGMDQGSQYLVDHFLPQNRFGGLTPSFAFVSEPKLTGGERFFRTLAKQAI